MLEPGIAAIGDMPVLGRPGFVYNHTDMPGHCGESQ